MWLNDEAIWEQVNNNFRMCILFHYNSYTYQQFICLNNITTCVLLIFLIDEYWIISYIKSIFALHWLWTTFENAFFKITTNMTLCSVFSGNSLFRLYQYEFHPIMVPRRLRAWHLRADTWVEWPGAAEHFKIRWGSSLSSLHVPSFTVLIQVRFSLILPNLDKTQVF